MSRWSEPLEMLVFEEEGALLISKDGISLTLPKLIKLDTFLLLQTLPK